MDARVAGAAVAAAAAAGALSLGCCAALGDGGGGGTASSSISSSSTSDSDATGHRVMLYYKYVEIESLDEVVSWTQQLAGELGLLGRVLLANEGVNGSVSGTPAACDSYIAAMDAHPLFGGIDWKSSGCREGELPVERGQVFGDLVVRAVKELVSTAGAVSLADVAAHGGKHLTPQEFHAGVLEAGQTDDVVLLDVRNTFESDIGRFDGATRVPMSSFSEYTAYAESRLPELRGKKVLMYCTGGIRCEKASAYLRKRGVADVSQLAGGIHRYLDAFPEEGESCYKGKNFVFDRRMSQSSGGSAVVGRCVGCEQPHDAYDPRMICCVCKQLVLLCTVCDASNISKQYHCPAHKSLAGCFFRFLEPFSAAELQQQEISLTELLGLAADSSTMGAGGGRSRRRTIRKQLKRVNDRLASLRSGDASQVSVDDWAARPACAYCAERDCPGNCWGVWAAPSSTAVSAHAINLLSREGHL